MEKIITDTIHTLIDKNIKEGFKGYDPYDFSNSSLKLFNTPDTRLMAKLSYLNKISIVNIRKCLHIPKTFNSKANALFLHALTSYDHQLYAKEINYLNNWFCDNQPVEFKPNFSSGFAFNISMSGYISGPQKTSLIISLFAIYALIDLYSKTKNADILNNILSFKSLIEERLPAVEDYSMLHYSYHFHKFDETYNATAKIGKFYALLFKNISPDEEYKVKIEKILKYLKSKQRPDGSWPYSNVLSYSDSFHTAFILESIHHMLQVCTQSIEYQQMFNKGLNNYKENFFKKGIPTHFHHIHHKTRGRSIIGIEMRDCANAIILFSAVNDNLKADETVRWTLENLYMKPKVYFYKNKFWTCKIDYIRWNAWLLYALVVYYNKFLR
jgi:hypothetical protein